MKKKLSILFAILMLVGTLLVLTSCLSPGRDTDTKIDSDGLEYSLDGNTYTVTGIGDCKDFDVVIPREYNGKAVTSIGEYAFSHCRSLTSIVIPDSVTEIGEWAFSYCTSLTNIEVDKNNKSYKSIDGNLYSNDGKTLIQYAEGKKSTTFVIPDSVTEIGYDAFYGCASLTSVEIGDGVTTIERNAFAHCTSLTSVEIGDSVTTIGGGAFMDCTSLTSIVIPDSVTSIENWGAFYGCASLTNIEVDKNNKSYKSIDGNLYSNDGKTLVQYAVGKKNTTFVLPDSVTTIGNNAFLDCTSLESINVDENNTTYKSIDGNLYTNDGKTLIQYAVGKKSTTFVIPDCVTTIGDYAFSDCSSLTSIVIPDSVTTIGVYAFLNCTSLTNVTIPDSVITIGERAFLNCTSLTSVVIGDSVTEIGEWAFSHCTSLTIYCEAASEPTGWVSNWNPSNRPVYWYSEDKPTSSGNYWHYVDGVVTIWK